MPTIETVGEFHCACCCGGLREHDNAECNVGYMRCTACGCKRIRTGGATHLVLRVQIAGTPTLDHIERASELARLLGAPDDISLVHDGAALNYFELSGQGAANALEIVKLRRGTGTKRS